MTYPLYSSPVSPLITLFSPESVGLLLRAATASFSTSVANPTANKAWYIPLVLRCPISVVQLFVANGGTAAGNFDVGIYTNDGVRLASLGSTAMSGTTVLQAASITPLTIGPGLYYIGIASDSTTAQFLSFGPGAGAQAERVLGIYQQTSAFPLPATATFASNSVTSGIPVAGLMTSQITVV